jgi:phosphoribosyl 1,2-cyclic phosphodiesterase
VDEGCECKLILKKSGFGVKMIYSKNPEKSMALSIAPLFSGSSGNSIFIRSTSACVLVDAGVSCTKIRGELGNLDVRLDDIDGILVTHEHIDHIRGLAVISQKYDIPVYANAQTWEQLLPRLPGIQSKNVREITAEDFYIKDICVQPFELSHDAACTFGYALTSRGKKVSVLTDLGHVTQKIIDAAAGSSIVLLEANHDVEMLNAGPYPYRLKHRILSAKGHLSNDAAAQAAFDLAKTGVRGIILGHLSINNNMEELAFQTVSGFLSGKGVQVGKHLGVALAKRDGMTGCYDAK